MRQYRTIKKKKKKSCHISRWDTKVDSNANICERCNTPITCTQWMREYGGVGKRYHEPYLCPSYVYIKQKAKVLLQTIQISVSTFVCKTVSLVVDNFPVINDRVLFFLDCKFLIFNRVFQNVRCSSIEP